MSAVGTRQSKTCALCRFEAANIDEFRSHMTDTHGWGKPTQGSASSDPGQIIVTIVSAVAVLWLALIAMGMGEIGYKYAPEVLARTYLLTALGVATVIGFDCVVIIGGRRRWRYRIPAAAFCLLIAGVALFVGGTTHY